MVSEGTSSLNGLTGLPARSKQSMETEVDHSLSKDSQLVTKCDDLPSFNILAEKYPQKSNKMASFFPAMAVSGVK